jgi:hypothetical protein
MTTKVWDMKTQVAIGEKGEELFLRYYPDLTRLDGRKGDFIGFSGRKIELKTDSRTTRDTLNFFMERIRNESTGLPGGPWQSAASEVYYFVYLFADGIIYWFETAALVSHLEAHEAKYKVHRIFNKGWTAVGWLVPRESLEELIVKKERLYERKESGN